MVGLKLKIKFIIINIMRNLFSIVCITTALSFSAFSDTEYTQTEKPHAVTKTSEHKAKPEVSSINLDHQKIIDDFIFLCFFVGNDFLPHLPSLSIREGALDGILFIYKNLLPSLGNYLTDGAGGLNFQ